MDDENRLFDSRPYSPPVDERNPPPLGKEAPAAPIKFCPTPFVPRDPATIPPRQFLYGRHVIREFLSGTVARAGIGKSSLTITDVLGMTSGRNLVGTPPVGKLNVWIVNLEDPRVEIERRIYATLAHYGIDPSEVAGRLWFDGREIEIVVAEQGRTGTKIAKPVEDALVAALIERKIDVLILDPIVSTHRVSENDNMAIDAVAKTFARIAGRANCAIEGVHHIRKTNGNDADFRGRPGRERVCRRRPLDPRPEHYDQGRGGESGHQRRGAFDTTSAPRSTRRTSRRPSRPSGIS
ncbi:ATP-binding protein [Roseiarcus sp.]|uniref:ATP-binding protein n=1 Tax=Roseiarcus sp. TaxID=1969460 RepID=UPI003F945CE6